MATLAEMLALLKIKVKDSSSRFSDSEKNDLIKEAIRQYNRDRPQIIDDVITGDGSAQTFAVPSDWVRGFSYITDIEYPINQEPAIMLDVQDNVRIIQRSNVDKVQFLSLVIPNTETARVYFTAPHDETAPTTIPQYGIDAVVNLAASKLCFAMAAFYAESAEPTLALDVVDRQGKADMFRSMGDRFKKEYVSIVSPKEDDANDGALEHVDQDVAFSWNHPHITHPPKNR